MRSRSTPLSGLRHARIHVTVRFVGWLALAVLGGRLYLHELLWHAFVEHVIRRGWYAYETTLAASKAATNSASVLRNRYCRLDAGRYGNNGTGQKEKLAGDR
jgi:hypothetical protein